jgi:hypothetical protein
MATGRIGTTPVLTVRWSKAPAAGTTSLSGLDDNSVSLVYSVGYEQVYLNGALLSRGNDYTATNGTSITLTNATVAGDIVEVIANATIALTDTYTQSQANGKFINNTLTTTTGDIIYASAANTPARLGIGSTDQVLKVSGGLPVWGAAPTASFVGCVAFLSSNQVVSNNTATAITLDGEIVDSDGFHSNTTNNTRITVPSGKAGKYFIFATVGMSNGGTTGERSLYIRKNGTTQSIALIGASAVTWWQQTDNLVLDLAVGDYIELFVNQVSGGTISYYGNSSVNYACKLGLIYLGA